MTYLLLAIITSSIILVFFKLFEKYNISSLQAITVNYLVAVLFGFFSSADSFSIQILTGKPWLFTSVLSGIMLMMTFLIYAFSIQKAGIAITSVSGKMSVIIPVLLGLLVFHEEASLIRIAGILTALLAFYLTLMKSRGQKLRPYYYIFPLLLFIGNGLNDSIFKISQELYINHDFTTFLTIAFFISMLIGLIITISRYIIGKEKFKYKNIIAGLILGTLNWYSTYFFFVGLDYFDVSVFIPVFNASIVCIAVLNGCIFFKERITTVNFIGIILSVIAIILIAWV